MERDPALLLDMLLSAKDALQFSAELTWRLFKQALSTSTQSLKR
jgi:hypothetical protein